MTMIVKLGKGKMPPEDAKFPDCTSRESAFYKSPGDSEDIDKCSSNASVSPSKGAALEE